MSELGQHAGEDLQTKILLVAQAVGTALQHADFVVDSLDEAQGDFVVGMAVGHDPMPVLLDQGGKLLVGLQALPFQRGTPVVEEAPSPSWLLVTPELLERFLQHVSRVQSLVGVEQQLQRFLSREGEVAPARQQGILLALDEATPRAGEPAVFALADLVQGILQMTQHVKLVVDNQSLGSMGLLEGGGAERLPHVHDGKPEFARFFGAKPGKELVHARLGAILAAEPNGPAADQVADHDAVAVPFADGDFVDADSPGRRLAGAAKLLVHVLLVQLLDRVPIQEQVLRHRLDRRVPAASSHEDGETLGVERIVGQPVQTFGLHGAAPRALDTTNEEVEIDAPVAAGEVAHSARSLIVEGRRHLSTAATNRFFSRRWSVRTTAQESPKIPWTVAKGSKPGKRYTSRSCRVVGIAPSSHVSREKKSPCCQEIITFWRDL
jgi:hypothetical protein